MVKPAKPWQTLVAQASQPAVSQPLSRSVNGKPMAFFIQNDAAKNRPERPQHDSPGQRPGCGALIAVKRCKRATILALTRRHSHVVAQPLSCFVNAKCSFPFVPKGHRILAGGKRSAATGPPRPPNPPRRGGGTETPHAANPSICPDGHRILARISHGNPAKPWPLWQVSKLAGRIGLHVD